MVIEMVIYYIQGEYYVPVRQTEAVVRLSISSWLIFLLSTEILYFLNKKNTFLKKIFTPGLQNDLQHNFTIFPTCPQHFGYPMQFGGCNWGCLIEKNGGAILLKVLKKLIPLRLKQQLSNRFGCWNCSICLSKCMLLA